MSFARRSKFFAISFPLIFQMSTLVRAFKTSLREDNVFSRVCLSVCSLCCLFTRGGGWLAFD